MAEYPTLDFKKIFETEFKKLYDKAEKAPAGSKIIENIMEIAELLIDKNISYGSSFNSPINIFSKNNAQEQLYVRIDDKLNRIKKGKEYASEDTILDLIGYLVLLRIINVRK
jgi:hypothetical protein